MEGIAYEYTAANHDGSHDYLYPTVSRLVNHLPPGTVVLDVGCGNGSFLSLFQGKDWRLHGSDLSPTGIRVARDTYRGISFFLADAQDPYSDFLHSVGQADLILSTEVIEHLYDPRTFLRNCFDLLRPGGTIVLSTPYHGYAKNLALALTGKMDQHFTVLWDHGHIKFWSRRTLSQALIEAGFTQLEFAGTGRIPYLWNSMIFKGTKAA